MRRHALSFTLLLGMFATTGCQNAQKSCNYEAPQCAANAVCAFVEKDKSACVSFAELATPVLAPFRTGQRFGCSQGSRSPRGRSHSFAGDIFATDLMNSTDAPTVEVVSPVDGEVFTYDGCAEREDGPNANNSSSCGLGYGNHVKVWDGTNIFLLAHLSHVKVSNHVRVHAGDVIGVEGTSGLAGHRHVHLTVSRVRAGQDPTHVLNEPGFKGDIPVRFRLRVAPTDQTAAQVPWIDELVCTENSLPRYIAE